MRCCNQVLESGVRVRGDYEVCRLVLGFVLLWVLRVPPAVRPTGTLCVTHRPSPRDCACEVVGCVKSTRGTGGAINQKYMLTPCAKVNAKVKIKMAIPGRIFTMPPG